MCHRIKTIAKNCNGKLSYCQGCKHYHLDFNNVSLQFNEKELKNFQKFLSEIDVDYWETKYGCHVMKRKIPIPTIQQNLVLMFNKEELASIKSLVFQKTVKYSDSLSAFDIDYTLLLN
ncbi:MAG: DUF6686 family protein [Bacteroidota bacterium]